MSDRTLRGARIGSSSIQSAEGVELSPRKQVTYLTEDGKTFTVTLSADVEPPPEWTDPRTGETGFLDDAAGEAARDEHGEKDKPQRTHWDMLLERRTREELEELLEERLQHLRSRRGQTDD